MSKNQRFFSLIVVFGAMIGALSSAENVHAGSERFAIVIGNNLGHDPERPLRYAERDATKVHAVLTELGSATKG